MDNGPGGRALFHTGRPGTNDRATGRRKVARDEACAPTWCMQHEWTRCRLSEGGAAAPGEPATPRSGLDLGDRDPGRSAFELDHVAVRRICGT
jgi:hypothetical protein